MIKAILAIGENGEIGQKGDMPWGRRLPKDLEYFKERTSDGIVIMGSNTWKSLPFYPKGLPKRRNYVLTSEGYGEQPEGIIKIKGELLHNCLSTGESVFNFNKDTWLVGGATVYNQFWKYVSEVHLTRVKASFLEADTFFKPDLEGFERVGDLVDVSGDDLGAYVEVWRRMDGRT